MKQIFKISIITVALICSFCQVSDARRKQVRHSKSTPASGKVENINISQYKLLVSDYERTPFIFKGKRPAVVLYDGDIFCQADLEQLAKQYKGKVDFYSIDSPYNMNDMYDFFCVPSTIIFTNSSLLKEYLVYDKRFVEHSLDLTLDSCAACSGSGLCDLYLFSEGKFFRFDTDKYYYLYDGNLISIIDEILNYLFNN